MRTARARTSWPEPACPSSSASSLLVKPVAKDPEAQALLVLDAEIIPRQRFAVLLPPFHGDALGALDPHHRMRDAPPGELMRRAVGHGRERHLDRLGLFEQPQGAQRRLAFDARGPGGLRRGGQMMLRRRGQHRALRNMGVLRQMHDHALSADARGDAVDQRGQFVIVMDMWHRDRAAAAPRSRCGWRRGE